MPQHEYDGLSFGEKFSEQQERDDLRFRREFRQEGTATLYDRFGGYYGNGGQAQGGYMGGMGTSANYRGRGPKGYVRSDEGIRDKVCQRLTDDPDVDATEVDVEVTSGEVTLTGAVESRGMRRAAEDVAAGVPGVRDVHNRIRIAGQNASQPQREDHQGERVEGTLSSTQTARQS